MSALPFMRLMRYRLCVENLKELLKVLQHLVSGRATVYAWITSVIHRILSCIASGYV